jgi:hypothetical protein
MVRLSWMLNIDYGSTKIVWQILYERRLDFPFSFTATACDLEPVLGAKNMYWIKI